MNYMDDLLDKQAYMDQNRPKKDPFDDGIMRAIKSAKQSIAMDDDQSDKALRNSILSFSESLHQQPKRRGFMANFAQAGRALGPAVQTHDQYEDEAKATNKQMLQYAQGLRAAEEAKSNNLEQQAYSRENADRAYNLQLQQLAEQRNHHAQMRDASLAKSNLVTNPFNHNLDEKGMIEGKYVPFAAKKDRDPYSKKLAGANLVTSHLADAQRIVDNFDNKYRGNALNAPLIGSPIGKSRTLIGHFRNDDAYRQEGIDRALLDQAINTISTKFEKELKGGILTGDIVKRFAAMGIVPVSGDSPEIIKSKLAQMVKVANDEKEIAEKSLLGNYHYAPSTEGKLADHMMGDPNALRNNEFFYMKNDNGEQIQIPNGDIQALEDAAKDGFTGWNND